MCSSCGWGLALQQLSRFAAWVPGMGWMGSGWPGGECGDTQTTGVRERKEGWEQRRIQNGEREGVRIEAANERRRKSPCALTVTLTLISFLILKS